MTTYRKGQRVRIEWPTGTVIEGPVTHVGGTQPDNWCVLGIGGAVSVDVPGVDDRRVTVLSEPRPDEPTGLGAVVEAEYKNYGRQRWVSARVADDRMGNRWVSVPYWGFIDWDLLIDPVVLSEGWTP